MRIVLTATLLTAALTGGSAVAQVPCSNCGTVPYVVLGRRVVVTAPRTMVTPGYTVRQYPYSVPARPGHWFFNRPDTSGPFVPPPPIPMVHIPEPVIPHPQ